MTLAALFTGRRGHTRADYEAMIDALQVERDRALGRVTVMRERILRHLDEAADGHDADARYLDERKIAGHLSAAAHRAVATALRDIARDFEETMRG